MRASESRFQIFFEALEALAVDRLHTAPSAAELPSPWDAWTLLGLVRHRERQYWVAEVIRTKLGGDLDLLAKSGAAGHPEDLPGYGIVPGLPDWEYRFHGRGCVLTRRKDGVAIDVDFTDDNAEFIDRSFYINFLKSLREPDPLERRILELHPSVDSIEVSLDFLREAGLLTGGSSVGFSLSDDLIDRREQLLSMIQRWQSRDLAAVPAPFVDWLVAGERGELARNERALRLRQAMKDSPSFASIRGLADLGVPDIDACLRQVLQGKPGPSMSAALELIVESADPKWCEDIYALFERRNREVFRGAPYAWKLCVTFLLARSFRTKEVCDALSREAGLLDGEMGLIAMEHAPHLALPVFRRALRSSIPLCRDEAAAILALFDRPWSRGELMAVLSESDDQHQTAAARAGLRLCHDQQAGEAVAQWDATHYLPPVEGRSIRLDDAMLLEVDAMVAWHMEDFHERVMKIRDREPA